MSLGRTFYFAYSPFLIISCELSQIISHQSAPSVRPHMSSLRAGMALINLDIQELNTGAWLRAQKALQKWRTMCMICWIDQCRRACLQCFSCWPQGRWRGPWFWHHVCTGIRVCVAWEAAEGLWDWELRPTLANIDSIALPESHDWGQQTSILGQSSSTCGWEVMHCGGWENDHWIQSTWAHILPLTLTSSCVTTNQVLNPSTKWDDWSHCKDSR